MVGGSGERGSKAWVTYPGDRDSRPNGRVILGDLADRLKLLSRAQRWEEMPQHINDDVLHTFVTIATYDTIARKLCDRYGSVVTNCEFSIAVKSDADRERLRQLASDIQSEGVARARRTILGIAA